MTTILPPPAWDVAVRHLIRLGAAAVTMGVRRLPGDHRDGEAAGIALRALHDVNCATFSDRPFEEIGMALIAGLDPLAELGFEPIALFALAVGNRKADREPEAERAIWAALRQRMDDIDAWFLSGLRELATSGQRTSPNRGMVNYAPRILRDRSTSCADIPLEELEGAMRRLLDSGRIRVVTEGAPSRQRSRLVVVETPYAEA